jgi:DNA repair exonuclease SbcCD nuclease subunit
MSTKDANTPLKIRYEEAGGGEVLIMADVHVEHSVSSNNSQGEAKSVLVLAEITRIIFEKKPKHVVIVGDFYDAHGEIEADIANISKEYVLSWLGVVKSIVFVVGNHEYRTVLPYYFGKSMIKALFGGLESIGVYVIDDEAKFIRLEENLVILGLPYRETWEQFEATCLVPYSRQMDEGAFRKGEDSVLVCWHVGLPFGENCWRGDENENGWITKDHPVIRELVGEIASGNTVFCGHYHGPAVVPCGDFGRFVYVGSPATRTKSESGQDKRVILVARDGSFEGVSTGLALDHVVTSVEDAKSHLLKMEARFGKVSLDVTTVHVDLGEGASLDDFNIAREKAKRLPGNVQIIYPEIEKKSRVAHLAEKMKSDPTYTKLQMEFDVAKVALREHYRGKAFKGMSEASFDAMVSVDPELWRGLVRTKDMKRRESILKEVESHLISKSVSLADLPELTDDVTKQILMATLGKKNIEFIGNSV